LGAPAGPYGAVLSSFRGDNPNGTGQLYAINTDFDLTNSGNPVRVGYILDGWDLILGTVAPPLIQSSGPFSNPATITVSSTTPSLASLATPYPSTITVIGVPGTVRDVTVTLDGVTADDPSFIDLVVVGPGGQAAYLWSECNPGRANG